MRTILTTESARRRPAALRRLRGPAALRRLRGPAALAPFLALVVACAGSPIPGAGSGRIVVVAAENFWGSIAAQLAGGHAQVVSIISNPDTDPHAYEPTAQDGRTIAQAQYVIVNGAGYDPWAPQLADANPSADRTVLTIADLAGRREGDNPHMWYSPSIVHEVVDRIAADLERIDSADAADFEQRRQSFVSAGLRSYDELRAQIRQRYAGVPVGATESVVVDLAQDLGLDLRTPVGYMRSISEGDDPSAADKSTVDAQIAQRQIKVLVYNRQNSTPDIQGLVDRATSLGIPVVAVTETLDPGTATFEEWQSGQLASLRDALARAAAR